MLKKLSVALLSFILLFTPVALRAEGDINTLDYFVSKHLDKTLTGSHNQNQAVSGNVSYYVKWSKDAYEVHTWDDEYIYLREDHGWKYDEGYAFAPGRWMKRNMKVGESILETGNLGYYFKYKSCELRDVRPLPYVTTLENRIIDHDLGGDLGKQDVIVLKYDYSTNAHPGNFEKFYYSKEWGWVKWELYTANSLVQTSVFNKIAHEPVLPDVGVSCTRGGTYQGNTPYAGPLVLLRSNNNGLVRVQGNPTVYYISESGHRIPIPSYSVFLSYGHTDSKVQLISEGELNMYPPVNFIKLLGTNSVYKLEGATKRRVSPAALKRLNVLPSEVLGINQENLNAYKLGKAIKY